MAAEPGKLTLAEEQQLDQGVSCFEREANTRVLAVAVGMASVVLDGVALVPALAAVSRVELEMVSIVRSRLVLAPEQGTLR